MCRCGNRGCLETLAATGALVELLRRSHGEDVTVARMLELARAGDLGCRRVIADAGRAIGQAVSMLLNVLNPELLVVGGDLAAAGDLLLDGVRESIARARPAVGGGRRRRGGRRARGASTGAGRDRPRGL